MWDIFKEAIFFLILINPFSKAVMVTMFPKSIKDEKVGMALVEASFIALVMITVFAFAGRFILNDLFQININALRIAGGFVLAVIGYKALDKGIFFQYDMHKSIWDFAVVPFASPMIAGPATITAVIVKSSSGSPALVVLAVMLAIIANLGVMYFSLKTKWLIKRVNLSGALIRITGLFMMGIGVNMIIVGIKEFFML